MITSEDRTRALAWLYEKGNPIIKLWAAGRLGAPEYELERLRVDMLRHPDVVYWVDQLLSLPERRMLHGSFDRCLENSMRKVLLFGVKESDNKRLATLNAGVLERLAGQMEHSVWTDPLWLNPVEYTIMASYLAAMGHAEPPVTALIRSRLDDSCEFSALGGPDMYADPAGYPAIPASRSGHPLVHPKFNEGERYRYPLVYDLFGYANLPVSLTDADTKSGIGTVMGIVLDERYQRLQPGYGLIFVPPNKYYSMGWSVHLPRFFAEEDSRLSTGGSVWWAEAMAHFPAAVCSDWFRRILEYLDGFRTADGFWKFRAADLTEAPDKYFVGGGHMGLGENRRMRDALKLESTAWMLRISEAAQGCAGVAG